MSYAGVRNALDRYSQNAVQAGVESATPHRLIQMLLEGALDRIAAARGLLERGDMAGKGRQITSVIAILDGLRASLDHEKGGEIAANLEDLYLYMSRRLVESHARNDPAALDEVADLLREIKSAWDAIASHPAVQAHPAA
ncbi:MAG TPA: flagellar export chaperone FliS [Gammaproteobacteria bacterium]|nr:flagellar export chaperone FliS [Gammaproteobacteria bacterium]